MNNKIIIAELNRDFEQIIENCVRKVLHEAEFSLNKQSDHCGQQNDDIINIDTACQILNYSKYTLYSKVSKKQIPIVSRGRPLLFSRQVILKWAKAGRPPTYKIDEIDKILGSGNGSSNE